jgi:hypothetical protein
MMRYKICDVYIIVSKNRLSTLTVKSPRNIILFCTGIVGGRPSRVGSGIHPPVRALLPCHAASDVVQLTWVLMMMTDIITRGLEILQGRHHSFR